MRMILIVLAALSCQQYSFADANDDAAIQASLDARNQFVSALEHKDFQGITHDALDYVIRALAEQVRAQYNDDQMAQDLLNQWNQTSPKFDALLAARLNSRDLGDHDPLFPWLNNYIVQLAEKYGALIYAIQLVKDIQILNFAIPVVFKPNGSWQSPDVDSRIEYRKHFIPFANVVTYYVTLYGCKYELAKHGMKDLKQICGKAATKLEFYMGRYIAPVVSDWIFKETSKDLQVSDSQLHYTTMEQLRASIQH